MYHEGDDEVLVFELLGEVLDLLLEVAENDALLDLEVLVELNQGQELPLLLVDRDVVLLDTVEGQLFVLDQDGRGVAHKLFGKLKDLWGHGG